MENGCYLKMVVVVVVVVMVVVVVEVMSVVVIVSAVASEFLSLWQSPRSDVGGHEERVAEAGVGTRSRGGAVSTCRTGSLRRRTIQRFEPSRCFLCVLCFTTALLVLMPALFAIWNS